MGWDSTAIHLSEDCLMSLFFPLCFFGCPAGLLKETYHGNGEMKVSAF